jgi:hypothetical protein
VTDTVGRLKSRKDRRRERELAPEHDFSVAGIGISVICVVIAVMFSI